MIRHTELSPKELKKRFRNKEISFGGNLKLKIYGTLNCKSGKRMKPQNRVFFKSEIEAIASGFRPCAHCLNKKYKEWTYSA
jgi:methylphosphotriester-DNA--protein-cysteine methyltransferase